MRGGKFTAQVEASLCEGPPSYRWSHQIVERKLCTFLWFGSILQ